MYPREDHMKTYQDINGETCQAVCLEGPTILNTINGEQCGEAGQWAVYVAANEGRPAILNGDQFASAFTLME